MRLQMLLCRVQHIAEDAHRLSGHGVRNHIAKRCTNPLLQTQMQRLLVPCPVILALEGVGTERALEYA